MRRMWPEEFNAVFNGAEEVMLESPAEAGEAPLHRKALRARITMEDYERIWPLAEMRFRLGEGNLAGKAVTLITTNPPLPRLASEGRRQRRVGLRQRPPLQDGLYRRAFSARRRQGNVSRLICPSRCRPRARTGLGILLTPM